MSKIIRYTNSGHRFEIEGILEAGYSVIVTVIPANGYEFVQWLTGLPNITEIDPDDEGHRCFSIYIDECGLSFASLFLPTGPDKCDKEDIYKRLSDLLCDNNLMEEDNIPCDEIENTLNNILCKSI